MIGFTNLFPVLFPFYPLEHLGVHHKAVGTTLDPVTAQTNSNVYSYAINIYLFAIKYNFKVSKLVFTISVVGICLWLTLIYKIFDL